MISGSLRAGSTNTALLRTAAALEPPGVSAVLYEGLAGLPHFNPDDDPDGGRPPAPVAELRGALAATDALLFCTPEYAGALPGALKNLLDWSVGGGETYGLPVAWVNAAGAAAPTGARLAHDSLRTVLGYTGSRIVEAACVRIPVPRAEVGDDRLIADPAIRAGVRGVLARLAQEAGG
ncbi:MAG TPA: NADPH-dependent FMN reductase [Solirubrobacteraceae bacterium]|nr:NADPH-dependent FMN reductase [Solirubrobacteraceae bacterium]